MSSLRQFKNVFLENNVLNGREVKLVKNDKERVRMVCKLKGKCGYKILVSRVVRTTTFRVKTLYPKHTCGRVFSNKSIKSKWVGKIIVYKMKNNGKVKLNEVVGDIRTQFSTEIYGARAFKERQIAREIVEGDSSKKYSLFWSYSAELRRASSENTCKLELETISPNLEP